MLSGLLQRGPRSKKGAGEDLGSGGRTAEADLKRIGKTIQWKSGGSHASDALHFDHQSKQEKEKSWRTFKPN